MYMDTYCACLVLLGFGGDTLRSIRILLQAFHSGDTSGGVGRNWGNQMQFQTQVKLVL